MKFNNETEKNQYINEIAKRLVTSKTKDFFKQFRIVIPNGATYETLPEDVKSKVNDVATKFIPIVDDEFSLLNFFGVPTGDMRELELAYFYCVAAEEFNIDPGFEETKMNYDAAKSIINKYNYELSSNALDEVRNKAVAKFMALKAEHMQDVFDVSGDAFDSSKKQFLEDNYHGNVEGDFERRLFCVMLLKSIKKFDKTGKLENVKGIGGGYYNDGDNYGITFTFNGVKYNFSDKNEEGSERIPHEKEQLEIVERINDCCDNRYKIKVYDESALESDAPQMM